MDPYWNPSTVNWNRQFGGNLFQQGTDASPVGHWTQALARVLQGGMGGYMSGQANRAEAAGKQGVADIYRQGLERGDGMNKIAAALMANPWGADQGQKLGQQYMTTRANQGFQREQQDRQFAQQKEMAEIQNRYAIGQQGASQAHAARMAELNQRLQIEAAGKKAAERYAIGQRYGLQGNELNNFAMQYAPKPNTFDLKPDETRFELRPGPTPGTSVAVPIATGGVRNKADEAYNNELAKGDAKQILEMVAGYPATQQSLGKIGVMRQLSEHIGNPGVMNTIANSQLGRAARAVGLAPEQMATVESFTAMVNQLVPQQRPPGSGTMSDKDVELFKASLPAVAATKEGRDFILTQAEMIAQYDAARAQIAQDIRAGRIGRADGMDKMMRLPNPLAQLEQNLQRFGIAGAGRAPQAPGAVPQQGGGAQRHINPQTGQIIEWNGSQWVSVGRSGPPPQQVDANGVPYPPTSY